MGVAIAVVIALMVGTFVGWGARATVEREYEGEDLIPQQEEG